MAKTLFLKSTQLLCFIVFCFVMMLNTVNASPVETFVFKDDVTKVRFQVLSKELRCPKCQNQNLADSNSPISVDLRRELYGLLQEGKADSEIINFMVERYGEFVLYRPRVSSITYILWFGPALLMFIGLIVVIMIVRRKPEKEEELTLTLEQKEKLKQVLKDK